MLVRPDRQWDEPRLAAAGCGPLRREQASFSPGVKEKLEVAGVLTGGAVLKDAKEGEPAPGMPIFSTLAEPYLAVALRGGQRETDMPPG